MLFEIKGTGTNSIPETKDSTTDTEKLKKDARAKGEYIVTISGDEKGLTAIARRFNMSLSEFKNLTGLTKDTLVKGQVIKNVPHAKIPDGKGLNYLAKQNGMSLEELLKLNGLPKNYKPSKDEYFYVYPKTKEPVKKNEIQKSNSVTRKTVTEKPQFPKEQPAAPNEIAEQISDAVSSNIGAVGKEDFSKAFLQINDKNVKQVIKAYDELPDNDESLINAICSEIMSSKELRKDAVMTIYDNLAKQTNASTPAKRQEFKAELDKEFNKFIGMVSTDKLDEMINEMIDYNSKTVKRTTGGKFADEVLKTSNGGNSEDITGATLTSIKDGNGKYVTAGTLKSWAISSGKRDKGFSKVENPYIVRPLPNYNTETKKIEALTELRDSTGTGDLNGKVVILNSGHGGYQQNNGYFDPGTVLSVKNAEGKEMPIEEWRVAQSFVDNLSDELRSRGANVVFVSGAVRNGGMAKQHYLENLIEGKKGSDEVRELISGTDKSDMLFLSVHVESAKEKPDSRMCTVRYTKDIDKKLSENINKHLQNGFMALTPDVTHDNLYVNNATKGVTSSLLEIGNIANGEITNSLLSSYDQKKYMKCVADAIEETMNN
ncbi:MAG TPA: N-acetylmuramoyl-L-alanine amidase [Candidatus Stercorousia faecigallinarum]|nr:N-acetylmuramoyl-L-alanine amidase [Candidatus Stercorousia faecigallinarum]